MDGPERLTNAAITIAKALRNFPPDHRAILLSWYLSDDQPLKPTERQQITRALTTISRALRTLSGSEQQTVCSLVRTLYAPCDLPPPAAPPDP